MSNIRDKNNYGTTHQPILQRVEVDFGALPIASQEFVIYNPLVQYTSIISAALSYDSPTNKDLDEVTMDNLNIICGNCSKGFFTMVINAVDGSYLHDKFLINYTIN